MDLQERTKQGALCVIRMYLALPKNAEAQMIGRQILCAGTSVDVHSRQERYSHSGEPCGARHPEGPLHGAHSHTVADGLPAYVSTCTKERWR
jgi:hypothetical protein